MYQTFCGWTNCDVVTVDTSQMLKAFQDGGDISEAVAHEVLELLGMGDDRGL
jgi:hypothetical protein